MNLSQSIGAAAIDAGAAFLEALSERSVHLCVDMQRLFSADGPWATRWMDRVLPNVAEIAERQAKRTVFTRFIPPVRPEDMPGRWRAYYTFWREATRERVDPGLLDLVPALARFVPPATIIDKPVYSPFAGRRLPALLRARDTDVLVITGTETDVCVLATVLGAIDRGHAVLLVSDAVCSFSDAGHDALMTLYRERFSLQVGTATTAEVLAAWRA